MDYDIHKTAVKTDSLGESDCLFSFFGLHIIYVKPPRADGEAIFLRKEAAPMFDPKSILILLDVLLHLVDDDDD